MAAPCFIMWNAAVTALSSPMAGVVTSATAGTVKTLLQLKLGGTGKGRIIEWGYIFTATPSGPVQMELVETGTVFATVTSASTTDVVNYNDVTGPTSNFVAGTSASGYTASAEGTITATRLLGQTYDSATYFKEKFPLGREPEIGNGTSLRIRATPSTNAAVTVLCYCIWEE